MHIAYYTNNTDRYRLHVIDIWGVFKTLICTDLERQPFGGGKFQFNNLVRVLGNLSIFIRYY